MDFTDCIVLKTLNPKEKRYRGVKSASFFLFTGANDIHGGSKQRFTGIRFLGRNRMSLIKMTQYKAILERLLKK
jgi:hypothetical protein